MKPICIICGKSSIAENLCVSCFRKRKHLFSIEDFSLAYCKGCDITYYKDKAVDLTNLISHMIRNPKIKTINITYKHIGNRIKTRIHCQGMIHPRIMKTEEKIIMVTMKKAKCENCVKQSGGYYEAMFQIRGEHSNVLLDEILKLCKKITLTNVQRDKNGYNIKFMNKNDAAKVVRNLKKYSIKKSYKLITRKEGKDIYRDFYSVR